MIHNVSKRPQRPEDRDLSPREIREMRARGEMIEEEEPKKKAPLPFRLIAYAAVVVIFLGIGYFGVEMVFGWLNGRAGVRTPENVVSNEQEAAEVVESAIVSETSREANTVSVVLYVPQGNGFATRNIQCVAGVKEDTMKQALASYLDSVKEGALLDASAQNLNLFQSGEWLYVNMNSAFKSSLQKIGAERSRYLITGMLRTMSENFKPINKIKFFVNGKEDKSKDPVDISVAWSM